jgi:hypothetical protein
MNVQIKYMVVQIWPGKNVTFLLTNSPGNIWTTLYYKEIAQHTSNN